MFSRFIFDFFSKNSIPDWQCPSCGRATLELVKDSFTTFRTAAAQHHYDVDDGLSPEDDENVFTCLLVCRQRNCRQPVSLTGDGYYEEDYSGRSLTYASVYRPRYFYPPLTLFTPCDDYPDKIKVQLKELSAQLPGHPNAAINALRTTLEIVLDYFNIPRTDKDGRYLSLSKRISFIREPNEYIKRGFTAMKWLGNTGSHNLQDISKEDIASACFMLDDFLLLIFRKPNDHEATIARLIENHDPSSKDQQGES
jgi:hypothetical protein